VTGAPVEVIVLIDLAIILSVARVGAAIARRLGQPEVIGEIVAGLALGPSLLGLLPGDLPQVLFPPEAHPFLAMLGQLGVVLFMFLVGYELDPQGVRHARAAVTGVSAGSILLPFVGGVGLALLLYPRHDEVGRPPVSPLPLALFVGAAMAVTAFPVLARILADTGLVGTATATTVLVSASINDLFAWVLLAVIVALLGGGGALALTALVAQLAVFLAVLWWIVRPLLARVARYALQRVGGETFVLVAVVVGLLAAAWATSSMGLHAIIGAFVFGVLMPRDALRSGAPRLPYRVGRLSVLLLPAFFVTAGLSVDLRMGWADVLELAAVIAVASLGKFLGAGLGGLAAGMAPRDAVRVGVLMNARGLTELIVLGVGRETGVLDDRLFTILTVMAVVTTVMTGPLVRLILARPAERVRRPQQPGRSERRRPRRCACPTAPYR